MRNSISQLEKLTYFDDEYLIILDIDGLIIQSNQSWQNYCKEYNLSDSLWQTGTDYLSLLEKCGKENGLQSIKRILTRESEEYKQLYPFALPDGSVQWFQVKIQGFKSSHDNMLGAIVYHSPVTLHTIGPISAELILESMTEGFYLLDEDLHLLYINTIGEKVLKCSQQDVIGKLIWDCFKEAIDTPFHYHYERALREKTVLEFSEFYKPLDTWFQVKAYPLNKGGLAVYFQDVSEQKTAESQLVESVYYDSLTGLPNHRSLNHKVHSLMEQEKPFFVLHLTIDNLSFINAAHQYSVGDDITKKAAEVLSGLANDSCYAARISRNEFILLKEIRSGDTPERLAACMEKIFLKPVRLSNSESINISFSVGAARYPMDSPLIDEVFSYAELAMEEAKKIHGSSQAIFNSEMQLIRNRRVAIEKGLSGDLKKNGFYFNLQPQIDGRTGKIVGSEILARWKHPELGEISPLEFIPAAEETGAIFPLTAHLLEEVFTQLKIWEDRFGWKLSTAINMTPSLLGNPRFYDKFSKLMFQHEIDPCLIEIEITEQAELTYSPQTLDNLLLYKSKGMSIAIDDFGTGFSMISYLTTFPINKIKIDKSFVQKIGHDTKSRAVLKSLIQLANSIECELLAEGVERPEEAQFLQANECNVFQGYMFDKPMKAKDFEVKYILDRNQFQGQ